MNMPDEVLVMRAKVGDRDAFTKLFIRYKGEIRTCLLQVVHNDEIAKDLWQDTFLKAWRCIQGLKQPSSFKPWVLMIAKRLAIDWYRQDMQRKTVSLEEEGNTSELIDEDADPQRMIDLVTEQDLVQFILAKMEPVLRNVLLLSTDGYSRTEIAQQLGYAEGTVTTYLSRARKQFRQSYHMMKHNESNREKNQTEVCNDSKPESLDEEGHSLNKNRREI